MKREYLKRKSLPHVETWEAMIAAGLVVSFVFSTLIVIGITVALIGGKG